MGWMGGYDTSATNFSVIGSRHFLTNIFIPSPGCHLITNYVHVIYIMEHLCRGPLPGYLNAPNDQLWGKLALSL